MVLSFLNTLLSYPLLIYIVIIFLSTCTACAPKITLSRGQEPYVQSPQLTAHPEAYYHFLNAQKCMSEQNVNCALREFERAISFDPTSSYLHLQVCQVYALQGNGDTAIEWCEKAVELNPSDYNARTMLARIYSALDRSNDAISQYESLIALYPDNEEPYLSLALIYSAQKEYRKAIKLLNRLLRQGVRSENVFILFGNIYAEMHKNRKAEAFYHKALAINELSLPAREGLLLLYENDNNIALAISLCHEILASEPDNIKIREKLASLYLKSIDLAEARNQYVIIRSSKPYLWYETTIKIGLICFEQHSWDCAVEEFTNALNKNPGDDRAAYYLGSALEKVEHYEEAIHYFTKIPVSSWYFSHAQINRAFILDTLGQHDEAQRIVEEARSLKKTDPDLCRFLASVYEKKGKYHEAIAVLKDALSEQANDEDLLFYLGVLYDKATLFHESIEVMKKIIEHNSNHADALNFIGYSWADRGMHLDEAEKFIKKALKLKPNDGYIVDSLGWVYFKKKKLQKALLELEKAIKLVPQDPTISEHLGDVYAAVGNVSKALEYYRKALELEPSKKEILDKINALTTP